MGGWGLCKKDLNEISPSAEPRTAAKKGERIKEGGVKNKVTINPTVQVEFKNYDAPPDEKGKVPKGSTGSGTYRMSKKDYKKTHKDFKSDNPKKPRIQHYDKGPKSSPVKFNDEYQPEKSEKIDELSKKTLANYTRKSATSLAKHSMEFGSKPNKKDSKKLEKRHSGIMKAASKLANESLLDQIANAYVEEATRMKKEMGYDKGGTKKPTGPKAKDAALDAIKAKYKGQIMRTGSKQEKKVKGAKPSGGGKFKMMAIKKKETETAAKKAGYKNTQDYVNVQAVRKGGLGT